MTIHAQTIIKLKKSIQGGISKYIEFSLKLLMSDMNIVAGTAGMPVEPYEQY